METRGGKREGAGRPKGSKNIPLPEGFDDLGPDAVKVLRDQLKLGNEKVAMYVVDQIHGKARQRIEQTGPDGGPQQHEVKHLADYTDEEVMDLAEQVAAYKKAQNV